MSDCNKLYYKTCREMARLTQEQAVALLGIAEVATLSRYENGHAPVSQDLCASMVKVYQTPLLATWHLRYTNPDLAQYLPEVTSLITDGDMALQIAFANDDVAAIQESIKTILRDGIVGITEIADIEENAKKLRKAANYMLSAASYLECRTADKEL